MGKGSFQQNFPFSQLPHKSYPLGIFWNVQCVSHYWYWVIFLKKKLLQSLFLNLDKLYFCSTITPKSIVDFSCLTLYIQVASLNICKRKKKKLSRIVNVKREVQRQNTPGRNFSFSPLYPPSPILFYTTPTPVILETSLVSYAKRCSFERERDDFIRDVERGISLEPHICRGCATRLFFNQQDSLLRLLPHKHRLLYWRNMQQTTREGKREHSSMRLFQIQHRLYYTQKI